MVRTVEGSPVGHTKSQESNTVVCTVSYAEILRRNTLLSIQYMTIIKNIGYQRDTFMNLNHFFSGSVPVTCRWGEYASNQQG